MGRTQKRSPYQRFGLLTVVLILVVGSAVYASVNTQWSAYLAWIATLSIVTFVWYGYDKGQSKRDGQRVPESILHLLALLGGFPGAWLGRWIFRHKTHKGFFILVLVASTILHLFLVSRI